MEDTTTNFQEYITKSELPVLVDFWADWCGPCKMMAPVLHSLAQEWKGRINVIKVNTETKPVLSMQYGISAIPTMILFKNGREVHRIQGAMPLSAIKNELSGFV
ncbi:MAG TPA: thioredoxin [Chitinispirillaceae bacterium]|nr:thioredoxin [Chitinispirillaceae bacterium]